MLKFPKIHNPSIYLIGAGGTGGFTFTNLTRLLAGTNTPITIFDGDIVEPKNLKRQQFSKDDIGENKATALLNNATKTILDVSPINVIDQYITDEDEFIADILINLPENGTPIIISAVDNVATRKLINKALDDMIDYYIAIDSGNNNQGGQVVVTSNQMVREKRHAFDEDTLVQLANMFEVYPELNHVEDNNPGLHQSCDEVVESEPQAMMANSRNGDVIANIIMTLLADEDLAGNVYESKLTDFTTTTRTVTA